jgi:flavin-binding protein dodecin
MCRGIAAGPARRARQETRPGGRCRRRDFGSGRIRPPRKENTMSEVVKVIEISAQSSKGFDHAVSSGLKKVAKSVKNIKGAWVNEMKVLTAPDGTITHWRVNMRVSFVVE